MSKRTVTVLTCDRCKKADVPGTASLFVQTGWASCPAGGPSESDGKDVELCPPCMARAVSWFLKRGQLQQNDTFLKEFLK